MNKPANEETVTYSVKRRLTETEIKDVITTAIEGGIGYWACLLNDDKAYVETRNALKAVQKDVFYCDIIYKALKDGKRIRFQDADDIEDGDIWILTWNKLMKGIVLYEEKQGKSVRKSLQDGDFDACEADMVFQYALFEDVIYG